MRLTTPAASPAPMLASVSRAAAFFDLDKTVIAKSSALAFGRPLFRHGLINRRAVLRNSYAQFMFLVSGADSDQLDRMRDHLAAMCTGWEVAQVREIVAEALHEMIEPLIYAEAAELIAEHHAAGRDVVIVSGSGAEMVQPIGAMLGADHVVATRMAVQDGRYTGAVDFSAYGPRKAEAVRELAGRQGYDLALCYAYSDSATDVPMLEIIGHPTAVNPDRPLRKVAAERGWPVRSFARPVPLRRHVAAPVALGSVGGSLLALLAAAAVGWYVRRRARSQTGSGGVRGLPLRRGSA